MTTNDLIRLFRDTFPQYKEYIVAMYPKGKNTLLVRLSEHREFIFSATSSKDWTLKTYTGRENVMK